MSWVRRIAVDVRPLRESRDFRRLTVGELITGLGTQATLVALPYQVFVVTGSAFQTGLVGAPTRSTRSAAWGWPAPPS